MKFKIVIFGIMLFALASVASATVTKVNITAPTSGTWSTSASVDVVFWVTADWDKSISCNVTNGTGVILDEIIYGVRTDRAYTSAITVVEGAYTLNVTCWEGDSAVLVSNTTTLYVDLTPPTLSGLASNDTDEYVGKADSLNFTCACVEANKSGNVTLGYNSSYHQTMTYNTTHAWWAGNASDLGCTSDGSCVVIATVTSSASETSTDTLTLIIDDTSPVLSGLASDDTDNVSKKGADLTFTANYVETNVHYCSLGNSSTENMTCSGGICTLTTNVSDLGCTSDGGCLLTATMYDIVANSNTDTMTVTVDDTIGAVDNFTVNDSDYIALISDSINWTVQYQDTNAYACTIAGATMSSSGSRYYIVNTTSDVIDADGNCTYTSVYFICTDKAGNVNDSVYINNFTIIPCVETSDATLTVTASTAGTTLTLEYSSAATSSSTVWMNPSAYNTTHLYCPYTASNADKITSNFTTPNTNQTHCIVIIDKVASDSTTTVIQVGESIKEEPPLRVIPAAGGTIILAIGFYIVTRYRRRRGGTSS